MDVETKISGGSCAPRGPLFVAVHIDQPFEAVARNPQAKRAGSRHGHLWSHMWCDQGDTEQLHRIASKIGMKRAWFQDKPGFPHYDLTPTKRVKALEHGAIETDLKQWLRLQRGLALLT